MSTRLDRNVREVRGDLWDYWENGHWVVITTNGDIRADGANVMGRGVAKEAAIRFPELPMRLGDRLSVSGNKVHSFSQWHLFTFPVKHHWKTMAVPDLIETSAVLLVRLVAALNLNRVYMVRPGCGNGGLKWDDVRPILNRHLDERFFVVERHP